MPDSPKPIPFPYNLMEEVSSVLRIGVEKLLELSALKEREFQSQFQAFAAKKEFKMKEAESKHNKLVADLEKQKDRNDFLQAENERLAKVTFGTTFFFLFFRNIFLPA